MIGGLVGRLMNIEHGNVSDWGLKHISIDADSRILDIGCGGGRTIRKLAEAAPHGRVYGVDYSYDMVMLSRKINKSLIEKKRVEIICGEVSSLPFLNNAFDVITSFESCCFWPDLTRDLKEIKRILKPDGTLLIVNKGYTPDGEERLGTPWTRIADIQLYTRDEFSDCFRDAGYRDITVSDVPEKKWIAIIARKP